MDFGQLALFFFIIIFTCVAYKSYNNTRNNIAFESMVSTWENFEPNSPSFPGKNMNSQYTLLNDFLKPLPNFIAKGPTSQQCYQLDFQRNFERAGSYEQKTNNYIHRNPENCSGFNHDLILDFYKQN
jgi:hypothetical protein